MRSLARFASLILPAAMLLSCQGVTPMAGSQNAAPKDSPKPAFKEVATLGGYTIQSRSISFQSTIGTHSAWLTTPQTEKPLPALIVIHEWWGLNNNVRHEAEELARQGYVTLAIDLYGGEDTTDPKRAAELKDSVKDEDAVAMMKGAFEYVSGLPETRDRFVGSIGWCFGGRESLLLAMAEPRLRACVVYYGVPETNPAKLEQIRGSVLGVFGDKDQVISVDKVDAFRSGLKQAGVTSEVTRYEGVGHAFANPSNKAGYNSDAAERARRQTRRFLQTNLGSPSDFSDFTH